MRYGPWVESVAGDGEKCLKDHAVSCGSVVYVFTNPPYQQAARQAYVMCGVHAEAILSRTYALTLSV